MNLIPKLKETILLLVHHCLVRERTIDGLPRNIRVFLACSKKYNRKLHHAKGILFTKLVEWCSRINMAERIHYDLGKLE